MTNPRDHIARGRLFTGQRLLDAFRSVGNVVGGRGIIVTRSGGDTVVSLADHPIIPKGGTSHFHVGRINYSEETQGDGFNFNYGAVGLYDPSIRVGPVEDSEGNPPDPPNDVAMEPINRDKDTAPGDLGFDYLPATVAAGLDPGNVLGRAGTLFAGVHVLCLIIADLDGDPPVAPLGACRFTLGGKPTCGIVTEAVCQTLEDGVFQGEGSLCEPLPTLYRLWVPEIGTVQTCAPQSTAALDAPALAERL